MEAFSQLRFSSQIALGFPLLGTLLTQEVSGQKEKKGTQEAPGLSASHSLTDPQGPQEERTTQCGQSLHRPGWLGVLV